MNEGSGELEANDRRVKTSEKAVLVANRHLAAVKGELLEAEIRVKTLKDSLKAAKLGRKNAREAVKVASNDYEEALADRSDAYACAAVAREKWKVIDLVESEDEDGESRQIKRRNGELDSGNGKRSKTSSNNTVGVPESVVVQGCGVDGANGTYHKSKLFHYGHQLYCKQGLWNGDEVTYALRFGISGSYLGILDSSTDYDVMFKKRLYITRTRNGWKSFSKWHDPPPQFA